ncbi:hypothetical protein, partial [Deinococcus reticulitermitis]
MTRLQDAIAAARAAVVGSSTQPYMPLESIARARLAVTGQTSPAALATPAGATTRPAERPPALTARPKPGEGVAPRVVVRSAPSVATLEEITRGLELSRGARRLLELLHRLAQDVLKIRGHRLPPSQLVMHQAQELLAAALGAHRVTVWRWSRELERAGLLATRAHKATTRHRGADVTRNDGTLYAVPLRASHKPRLRFDDLRHQYRDLDADRHAGKTAFQVLQQS